MNADYLIFRSVENCRKMKEILELELKTKSISFSPGLSFEQNLKSMQNLINYSKKNNANLSILENKNLFIGFMFRLNNNGSVQVPWNWYENE